jgi:hypothetical protein
VAGAALAMLMVGVPGPPTDAQAIAAAMAAVPQQPRNVPGQAVSCDLDCPDWDGHDDVVAFEAPLDRTDRTVVYFPLRNEELAGVGERARDHLVAAGWAVGPVSIQDGDVQQLEASKGDLTLLLGVLPNEPSTPPVIVVVSKRFSVAAVVALCNGFAVGLLTGWMTAVWVLQRLRRLWLPRRVAVTAAALPFLFIAPFLVALSVLLAVADVQAGASPKVMKAPLFVIVGYLPVTVLVALSAAAAVLLAALPGRPDETGTSTRHPLRRLPA